MSGRSEAERVAAFLDGDVYAVVGASADRSKYGNRVLRTYMQNARTVYPVNPRGGEIEGLASSRSLAEVPATIHGVSIITPPSVTERVIEEIIGLGIEHVWMQPGAESLAAIGRAADAGLNVLAGGVCLLVVLGYQGD